MYGNQRIWEIPVLSSKHFCEFKTTLKMSGLLLLLFSFLSFNGIYQLK